MEMMTLINENQRLNKEINDLKNTNLSSTSNIINNTSTDNLYVCYYQYNSEYIRYFECNLPPHSEFDMDILPVFHNDNFLYCSLHQTAPPRGWAELFGSF